MEAPKMTYYARVFDNITNEQIVDFTDISKTPAWYYGHCDAINGGESQYVVEFDIWNNEPSFNAGTYDVHTANAVNCKLLVWPDTNCDPATVGNNPLFNLPKNPITNSNAFVYARCNTINSTQPFLPIKFNDCSVNINGNVNNNLNNTIQGNGDHSILQTKIILPAGSDLQKSNSRYQFIFAFYYDYSE